MICLALSLTIIAESQDNLNKSEPVEFSRVKISDSFWTPRIKAYYDKTLLTCIAQMRDSTKRISNFEKAAGLKTGSHEGIYFDDSDVYKAMEGMAYALSITRDKELEDLLDYWIDLVARSQLSDGYINTYYTLDHPDKRWTDIGMHEMYCGGHMIEAAIAHYRITGKTTFLDVGIKFADYLDRTFGPGKKHWVPGHEEIELALVKLFHVTGKERYLDLAHWLLEERGREFTDLKYNVNIQNDIPVSEITDIKGHAVRAMYLFSGMADVLAAKHVPEYREALNRVWDDVVNRNMYLTGGIGSSKSNEGFTEDFDLPNKEAYCETCASIGMVFWNSRMNILSGDSKYADVMERSLYNGVLSGVSLDGDLFFYVNPLESDGDHHRQRWFGCACCPSNIARFIPSVGNYFYTKSENEISVNIYAGNEANIKLGGIDVKLQQQTNYPWEGIVKLEIKPDAPFIFTLKMRIPGWCDEFSVSVNNKKLKNKTIKDGYLVINRLWNKGDFVTLNMKMPVRLIKDNDLVKENNGKRAVQRGPLVYCTEETDNTGSDFKKISLSRKNTFQLSEGSGKLNGMKLIKTNLNGSILTFIPYFAWDNREPGKMKVWIDYRE